MLSSRLFWKLFAVCVASNLMLAVGLAVLGSEVNTWVLVVAACVWAAALIWWLGVQIIRPVGALTATAEAVAAGDCRQGVHIANGDELGTLGRAIDRIRRAVELQASQLAAIDDRQLTVLDAMVEGVIAVDERQRVVLANPAAGRLFNFRTQAAKGRPLQELVRNYAVSAAAQRALSDGEFQRLEISVAGTEARSFDIHVQPLPGSPGAGAVLVVHDMTELRRLESIRREFIANVSHELKTPLASIKAYTETLRNGAIDEPGTSQRFLSRIEEQSERLHMLIMDMLTLARVESEQRNFEIESVNLAEVAANCLDEHRHSTTTKRISLGIEPGARACEEKHNGAASYYVRADREGLRQILGNLLDNAVNYTPEGGKISVGWEVEGEIIRTCVRDTGIGIKPEDQRRVFERFYRVDTARSRELGGTGLGLAIVKHLAQSFGGSVDVESEPGRGSTFTVSLPRA